MPMKKIAISLPAPVLETVDKMAAYRGESRSHVIASILSRVACVKRDRDITARIDALFADESMLTEQERTADAFLRIGPQPREEW
jgi:metal-responsive CopG/Arc/MetJ family transcriptional regulator